MAERVQQACCRGECIGLATFLAAHLCVKHASVTRKGAAVYLGLFAYQGVLGLILPGYQQEGLSIPSLGGKRLMYNCNALGAFYITCITFAGLHFADLFRLSILIDEFGPIMTTAIITSFAVSTICYFGTLWFGKPIRMSGNLIYDYFSMLPCTS